MKQLVTDVAAAVIFGGFCLALTVVLCRMLEAAR